MKKLKSKLTLNRETLRKLEELALQEVAGGGPTDRTYCRDCASLFSACCASGPC